MSGILLTPLTRVLRRKTPESPVAPDESYGKVDKDRDHMDGKKKEKLTSVKWEKKGEKRALKIRKKGERKQELQLL